ncbi:hypothetical protein GVAV_001022 [Gurleya vavrai]
MIQEIYFFLFIPSLRHLQVLDADKSLETNPILNSDFNLNIIINKETKYDIKTELTSISKNDNALEIIIKFEDLVRHLIESFFDLLLFNIHFYNINNRNDKIEKFLNIDINIIKQYGSNATTIQNKNIKHFQNILNLFKSDFDSKIANLRLFFENSILSQQLNKPKNEETNLELLKKYISYDHHSCEMIKILGKIHSSNINKRKINLNDESEEQRRKIQKI